MTRRDFLKMVPLAGLAGCAAPSGKTLRMFVYDGGHHEAIRSAFVPHFERLTGATVLLSPGWWDGMAKLEASPAKSPPYDLMITDATQGYPAARKGRFRAINWANVPNKEALVPQAIDHWVCREGHGLTYPDAVMTLAYRRDRVEPPPTRWNDLLRDDLSGKLGLYNHYYLSLYTFACVLAERSTPVGDARRLLTESTDEVFRLARESRDRVRLWWPTTGQMMQALALNEVAAGNMQSPEYHQAMRSQQSFAACVPPENRAMVQVFWAIPEHTPEPELAERAVNELFGPEVQTALAERGSATARLDVAEEIAAADRAWADLYPHTAESFARVGYYPYDFYDAHGPELADRWDRTVLRG